MGDYSALAKHISEEASSLRFPPGVWPQQFTYDGSTFTRGRPKFSSDGELVSYQYHGRKDNSAVILTVYND